MAGVVCVAMPRVGLGLASCDVLFPLVSPHLKCVCCHSIVGLGLCVCDRVVSLWGSGDGLCWCGRAVGGVYCLRARTWVVCVSVWCVMAVRVVSCRIVLWVVEWRVCDGVCGSCCLSCLLRLLPLPFLLVVFGVVRAQPSEHARYPRTPSCLPCVSCLLFCSVLFCSAPRFSFVEWR